MSTAGDLAPLLAQLRNDLGYRCIARGILALERMRPALESIGPECDRCGEFVGLVAQWVDAGFEGPELLPRLLAKFPTKARSALPLVDYLHLRMAEGVVAMQEEDFDRALEHFRFVQSLENEIDDSELLAIANFWIGRCLRRRGQYDDAENYIVRGEELALACGYLQMAAVMQTTRSWLAFQKGRFHDALAILRRAEEALCRTDDYLSRGNIQSAYGRIARRQGRHQPALDYFERAIAEYRQGGGGQPQLARALLNLAFVKRLVALQMQKEWDRLSASRRTARDEAGQNDRAREQRAKIESIRREAGGHLEESMAIYARHHNHRGIAGVHINRGFLYVDSGDLECATAEAAEAFRHGEEKNDWIVRARARILQCIVENAALEEQVGDPARHRETAEAFAREAVDFASQTQNRRLLARAYVVQGLTLSAGPYVDLDAARRCCDKAISLLQPEGPERQHAWDDLDALKSRVVHASPLDPLLRAWSAGIVHEKSFQEMTEEFARIVIPKVWEHEGRKVSRVAEKLSISPKKVRRILHLAGLSEARSARRPA